MRLNRLAFNLFLSLATILVCLILLEIGLRGYNATKILSGSSQADSSPPLHILVDSPILYALNPEHPEISSQGLRDDEVLIPKPEGTFRILLLGDSVAYGHNVSRKKTFPDRLEGLLARKIGSAEVINASVSGYTAYNELQYYLTKGKEFEPDIVIVAFCMNDVVNPKLHWNYTNEKIVNIPYEAIPNHNYDLLRKYSQLYNVLERRVQRLFQKKTKYIPSIDSEVPTYITGEDTLSIEALLDETSAEWQWLKSIYAQLHKAVQANQATLIIAILPLAYQIDEDYPFLPQNKIVEYCKQNSILCIDLLPSFRQHPKENLFLLNNSWYYDIWHLTEYGHALTAVEILRFLQEKELF